ncbi:hypothetical protein DMTZ50_0002 [Dehalococcoides mccartyi]|uniref:hypothetical protein n=1 Tax=Dehalococcoides mccartyi TaxID=61435 RepID=UPI0015E72EE9|nr:hypothetical protein [Dehalococcoides mccartyi]MBA2084201.1 hypothetical protein [Dehalococcoides mccartyi]
MSITTLKNCRLIMPGVFTFIIILFVLQDDFIGLNNTISILHDITTQDILLSIAVLVAGSLYYILGIRDLLWNQYHKRVKDNIKERLLAPFIDGFNDYQQYIIKSGNQLMNIFYNFIDNDKSLSEKANIVRFNGLICTSSVDATIITAFGAFIFLIRFIIDKGGYAIYMCLILVALSLFCRYLVELTTRKHIALSNEQLDVIIQLHQVDLGEKIRAINI